MLLGCHLSISGGLHRAFEQAKKLEINAMQIFSHNARSWKFSALTPEEIEQFKRAWTESPVEYIVIHTSYLINLASPKRNVYYGSIHALKKEIERAGQLGIPHVNTHVGAHLGIGAQEGLRRIARALDQALEGPEAETHPSVMILLENDAGTGTSLGAKFEELGTILDNVKHPERLGVCFDTCHGFAAGYDFRTPEGLEAVLREMDRAFGLEKLKLIHANDSRYPLGSRKDRHEHLGRGHIGLEGFRLVVNHPKLRDLPFILETPKADEEEDKLDSEMDVVNLNTIRSLRGAA
jgi:deoxyribonuclease-4